MSKVKLDQEEQELLDVFESGNFESDLTEERRVFFSQAADEAIKKDKHINIRISNRDLGALQRRALEEGVPYQTLITSILHKYISGWLQDITVNKHRTP